MRKNSIYSGNINGTIDSEYQMYDVEQEYDVYTLYTL